MACADARSISGGRGVKEGTVRFWERELLRFPLRIRQKSVKLFRGSPLPAMFSVF